MCKEFEEIVFEDESQKEIATLKFSNFAGTDYVEIKTETINIQTKESQMSDAVSMPVETFKKLVKPIFDVKERCTCQE